MIVEMWPQKIVEMDCLGFGIRNLPNIAYNYMFWYFFASFLSSVFRGHFEDTFLKIWDHII